MAAIAVQRADLNGTVVTYAAASVGGDTIVPQKGAVLHVRNGSVASISVTIVVPGSTSFGIAEPDVTTAIAAGAETVFSLATVGLGDPDTGAVSLTYSGVTTLTVAYIG